MLGVGFSELIILILILLVLLGPDQLPQVIKGIARFIKKTSQTRDDIESAVYKDESLRTIKESVEDIRTRIHSTTDPIRSAIRDELSSLNVDHSDKQDDLDKKKGEP